MTSVSCLTNVYMTNTNIAEKWTFILRLYGLQEPILNGTYKPVSPQLVEEQL